MECHGEYNSTRGVRLVEDVPVVVARVQEKCCPSEGAFMHDHLEWTWYGIVFKRNDQLCGIILLHLSYDSQTGPFSGNWRALPSLRLSSLSCASFLFNHGLPKPPYFGCILKGKESDSFRCSGSGTAEYTYTCVLRTPCNQVIHMDISISQPRSSYFSCLAFLVLLAM